MQVASVPSCSAPEESLRKSTNPAPGLRGGPDFPMITDLFRNWKFGPARRTIRPREAVPRELDRLGGEPQSERTQAGPDPSGAGDTQ
jgi:hypothetical protein